MAGKAVSSPIRTCASIPFLLDDRGPFGSPYLQRLTDGRLGRPSRGRTTFVQEEIDPELTLLRIEKTRREIAHFGTNCAIDCSCAIGCRPPASPERRL